MMADRNAPRLSHKFPHEHAAVAGKRIGDAPQIRTEGGR